VTTWYGIAVPAGTRPEIVTRLASTFERVLADPDVKAKLASQGAEVFFCRRRNSSPIWRTTPRG
jgi:Uncharacterized protein conserved in bacteria